MTFKKILLNHNSVKGQQNIQNHTKCKIKKNSSTLLSKLNCYWTLGIYQPLSKPWKQFENTTSTTKNRSYALSPNLIKNEGFPLFEKKNLFPLFKN